MAMSKGRNRLTRTGQRLPSTTDGPVGENAIRRLEHLVAPHVESFNYFLNSGLRTAVADISSLELKLENGPYIKLFVENVEIGIPMKGDDVLNGKLTPREARERLVTYSGIMTGFMKVIVESEEGFTRDFVFSFPMGGMPIMVMSNKCNLRGSSPQKLVALHEEGTEVGGYFIMNGIERVIRLLQLPRRNHAMAIERSSYKKRGNLYSDKGKSSSYVMSYSFVHSFICLFFRSVMHSLILIYYDHDLRCGHEMRSSGSIVCHNDIALLEQRRIDFEICTEETRISDSRCYCSPRSM